MDDVVGRVVKSIVSGLVAGLAVGLLLWVISALIPGFRIDASFWATIVGVLVALWTFFSPGPTRL